MHKVTLNEDDHNSHYNEEEGDFENCVPVMAHAESEDEAKEIAAVLTEEFGAEEA